MPVGAESELFFVLMKFSNFNFQKVVIRCIEHLQLLIMTLYCPEEF
jgi:hypothetical protein